MSKPPSADGGRPPRTFGLIRQQKCCLFARFEPISTEINKPPITILANAATTVAVVAYLICAVLAIVAPDLWVGLIQSWTHGLSLAPLRPTGPWFRPGEFIVGLITFGGSVWLATAAIAALYNRWSRG